MTSLLMAGAGIVALFAGSVGTRWLAHWWHQRGHARHAAGPPWEPVPAPENATLVLGSMTLDGERRMTGQEVAAEALRYLPAPYPADPVPWEDLQSDARIEDDRDGDQTAAWFHELGEDPGPGVDRPPPPGPVQDSESDWMAPPVAKPWPEETGASGGRGCALTGVRAPATAPEPTRLASAADVDAARPWLDVQLEDLYVWVRGVLAA